MDGLIDGVVNVASVTEVHKGAQFKGKLTTVRLVVEEGATINGEVLTEADDHAKVETNVFEFKTASSDKP
ncbi:hypothetical protein JCM12178A_24960 [Salidesulfovibrio brasiliensis]